jgi:hypothetical protein
MTKTNAPGTTPVSCVGSRMSPPLAYSIAEACAAARISSSEREFQKLPGIKWRPNFIPERKKAHRANRAGLPCAV